MKKIIVLFSLVSFIVISGCKKEQSASTSPVDKKVMVSEIFKAAMSWSTIVGTSNSTILKSSTPIDVPFDVTVPGTEGGHIDVTGSITGLVNVDDQSGAILSGTYIAFTLTESISSYVFTSKNVQYTMNGAPSIIVSGTFKFKTGTTPAFTTDSNMQLTGGVKVVGPDFNQTMSMSVKIIPNSTGTGGKMTGTVAGETINYAF